MPIPAACSTPLAGPPGNCDPPARLDVVCVPDMEWDSLLWTNRQQVMSRLPGALPGARVLYASPPRWALSARVGGASRLRPGARVSGGAPRRVGPGIWVSQPRLPVPNRIARRVAPAVVERLMLSSVRRGMRGLGFERPVLWAYTPRALPLVGRLGERLLCYDVVDDYPELPGCRALAAWHEALLRRADIVFTTSETLQARCRELNGSCHLVGNAADVELFLSARAPDLELPAELRALSRPLIGFHGAVTSYKLDLQLICELAGRRPQWSFAFVGPVQDRDARAALGALGNVHLLGPREQRALPGYVGHFDVCLVPYLRTAYTQGVTPIKLAECLAAGRPVVATDLPGLQPYSSLIATAADATGIELAIEAELRSPTPAPPASALRRWSWKRKTERMSALLMAALGKGTER